MISVVAQQNPNKAIFVSNSMFKTDLQLQVIWSGHVPVYPSSRRVNGSGRWGV